MIVCLFDGLLFAYKFVWMLCVPLMWDLLHLLIRFGCCLLVCSFCVLVLFCCDLLAG